MNVKILNAKWDISDECLWSSDWVGLSSGDIYVDERPFGHYIAAWYPNTSKAAKILITALDENLDPTLSIALKCWPGQVDSLSPVEPESVPWEADGVWCAPIIRPSNYKVHTLAQTALYLAPEIISQDFSLYKYLMDQRMQISTLKGIE